MHAGGMTAPSTDGTEDVVLELRPLGFPWQTDDPFLFCVHHDDAYPRGNEKMGPSASLSGRSIGQDFEGIDGWRMYHGQEVPGFPQHPHRGFETVTVARRGFIDHSDSLGAKARFGKGDAQWMTAGKGIVHSEMFPLLETGEPNPLELFQIWLNLPAADKLVDPHFTMLWNESIPRVTATDASGKTTEITVFAGKLGDVAPPAPPPKSWASRPDAHVAIWSIELSPGAEWTMPAAPAGVNRTLYFFRGDALSVGSRKVTAHAAVRVRPDAETHLVNGAAEAEVLVLQGRPIGETVAQYGPFVMNSRPQLQQAIDDYQRTRFGGWPWPHDEPVHPKESGRFAVHVGGREERPEQGK